MKETTWIIDSHNGNLTVEGLQHSELKVIAADLLSMGQQVNCARPINTPSLSNSLVHISTGEPALRVFRIYHHSVVEGPGRRSVLQTAGCLLQCPHCFAFETHPLNSGVEMTISEVIELLLATEGEPRDGVTVLGGDPFIQPNGLLVLMKRLKQLKCHVTLYTGYTLEDLCSRSDPVFKQILSLTDILIDGPFVKELSNNAGEWRGSTNQRIIHNPSKYSSTTRSEQVKS